MATKNNVPTIVAGKDYSITDLAEMRAAARGIDVGRAAKEVRGRLRANFAQVVKLDPRIAKVKVRANDGNRWPVVNAKVAALATAPRNATIAD